MDEDFVPDCARCIHSGNVAIEGLDTTPIVFTRKPKSGRRSLPKGWTVTVCVHPDVGARLTSDVRNFGAECGPMGKLYAELPK